MNAKTVEAVAKQAEVVGDMARDVLRKSQEDRYTFFGCKETAALRRASMDLTRLLAQMRKAS